MQQYFPIITLCKEGLEQYLSGIFLRVVSPPDHFPKLVTLELGVLVVNPVPAPLWRQVGGSYPVFWP